MLDEDRKTRVQRELFLRVLVLSKPPPSVARAMAEAIKDVRFAAGDDIYRQGDESAAQWWIVSGSVDLISADGEEPWHFGPGSVIGVLDVLLARPRARTAVALTDVEAMELAAEDWLEILEDNPDYLAQLRREVPRDLHDKMILQLSPDGGFPEPTPDDGRAAWLEMTAVDRLVALREIPVFRYASVQSIVECSRRAEVRRLEAGEVLFEEGEGRGKLSVVAAGIVAVERTKSPPIRGRFGRDQIVGGVTAFSERLDAYRAVAEVPSIVMTFRLSDLDDLCEDHFDLARSISRGSAIERERAQNAVARRRRLAAEAAADAAE
jgi:CRP-like cAMP-binding protein